MPELNDDDLASLELVLEWSAHRTFMSIYNAVFEDLIASGWDMPTDPSLPLSKRISVGFAIQQASGANYGDLSSWEVAMDRFDECLESYCKDQDDLAEWLQHRRALLKGYLFTVLLKHLGIDYDHKPKSLGQMRVPSSFNASKYRSEITRAVRDLGPKRSLSQDAFMVDRMEKRFLSVVSEGQVSTENTFEIIVENTFLQSDFPNLQIFLRKITDPLPRVDIGPSAASLSSSFAAANSSFAAARPKSAAKDIASLPARGDVRAAVENFNRNAAKNDPLPSVTGNKRNSSSFAARHGADDDDDDDEEEDTGRAHKQPAAKASKITNPTSKGQKVKSIDDDEAEEDEVVGFGDDGDDGFADSDDDAPPRGKSNVEALALKRKQAAATKPLPSKLPSSSSGSAAGGGGKVAKAKASKTATKPAAADANTTTLSNNGRRPRVAWSMDEEDAIKQGARDYGRWQDHRDKGASERVYVMDWKRVLDENKGVFDAQRRSNDLKDKWKNMFTKDRSLARPDDGSSPTRKASPAPKPKAKAKQQQKKSGGKKSSAKKRIVESTDEEEEDNGGEEEEEVEEEED